MTEVLALRAGLTTRVVVTDYWNVFEDGDVARADPTALLADDGDHPNAAGHALIARLMLEQLAP